jgi:hypothetical protein
MDEVCDVDKDQLFHKDFVENGVAKVLFSEEKPLIFKYNINREVLTYHFTMDTGTPMGFHNIEVKIPNKESPLLDVCIVYK